MADELGVGVRDGLTASWLVETLGEGLCVVAWPSPVDMDWLEGVGCVSGERDGDGVTVVGVPGFGVPDFEDGALRPASASPTVVLFPPLKLVPEASSYVVIPAIVTPKTTVAAISGRFQLLVRAR
jgi:hypothetical protein